jgi:leucyl-tRNA synthetase
LSKIFPIAIERGAMAKKTKKKTKTVKPARAAGKKKAEKKKIARKPAARKAKAKVTKTKPTKTKSAKGKAVKAKAATSKPAAAPAPHATPLAGKGAYYITTAISYPNGVPHIGHAYEVIATDAIARFMRLDGYDVYFLTGTDEHGQKIQQTAAKEGLTARQLLDRNVPRFEAMVERLNCSNDDFIHTTEPRHYDSSAAIWQRMEKNGDVYLSKYSGWYSVRDEAFYDQKETTVGEDKVRRSPHGTPVEWVEEESSRNCLIFTPSIRISCCPRSG